MRGLSGRQGSRGHQGAGPQATAAAGPGALAVALPFCAMGAVLAADLVTGPQIGLLPVLSVGPALAPVALSPARTVLVGLLAMMLSLGLAAVDGLWFTAHATVALATIGSVTAAGVVASVARRKKEQELVSVKAVADVAQRVVLRQVPREVGGDLIAVRYISAAAAARIGGDLYDVVAVPGATRLIVADVQGKGLAAVQTAAVVLAAFRESAYNATSLADIAGHIEYSLAHQAADGQFVTAIMAEVAAEGTDMRLLNCGHPAPLIISRGTGALAEPVEAALPLGLGHLSDGGDPADDRKEYSAALGPGDRALFYTDGISEARDRCGDFYQLVPRGVRALLAGADPDAALGLLYDDVLGHVGGHLHDDSAALLITRGG